jgi:hypothetical protein
MVGDTTFHGRCDQVVVVAPPISLRPVPLARRRAVEDDLTPKADAALPLCLPPRSSSTVTHVLCVCR